jgi:hypothetical protein
MSPCRIGCQPIIYAPARPAAPRGAFYNSGMKISKEGIEFIKQWEQEYQPPMRNEGGEFIPLLCSACFSDQGLKLVAEKFGIRMDVACPNCGATDSGKLDRLAARLVMQAFFNAGTMERLEYGGAPSLVCNSVHPTNIELAPWSGGDLDLICEKSGWGVFEYGPRHWMLGEVEPLKQLLSLETRQSIIQRILTEYSERIIGPGDSFYRMRKDMFGKVVEFPFDSPPLEFCGTGRLDSKDCPVLYGSQDIQVCVHECRTTVDDDTYVATLKPTKELRLLNLTHILREQIGVSEFKSLDLAVHMLFLAKSHSYEISRQLALAAKEGGFDGIIYPSYFSLIRTGARAFDTILGMSVRHIVELEQYAEGQMIGNIAIFGHPISEGKLRVSSVNRVMMARAEYDLSFGPVAYKSTWPLGEADPRSRTSKRMALFMRTAKEEADREADSSHEKTDHETTDTKSNS